MSGSGAKASLVASGPAVYEREKAFMAEDGKDLGRGAYYVAIGFEAGRTPPTAWLGLDTFGGRPVARTALKRITSMECYACNAHIPTGTANHLGNKEAAEVRLRPGQVGQASRLATTRLSPANRSRLPPHAARISPPGRAGVSPANHL